MSNLPNETTIGHGQYKGQNYVLIAPRTDYGLGPGVMFSIQPPDPRENRKLYCVRGWGTGVWVFQWLNDNWVSKAEAFGDYQALYEDALPYIKDMTGVPPPTKAAEGTEK